MSWFQRRVKGILTPTHAKKSVPDGMWYKRPGGKLIHMRTLREHAYVCPEDGYHVRVGSEVYFELLFDEGNFEELAHDLVAADPLVFVDHKAYQDRLQRAQETTELQDAIRIACGCVAKRNLTVACMDFAFIGGSMGAVVGEKIVRAVDHALTHSTPLLIICQSGGARMMEGAFSLMQMAKTSAKLQELAEARLPYISLLTHPTTGGVTASFAMLGDVILAEPGALVGFAGPRVIRETMGQDLPKGFQRAEFVLKHGFIDRIVDRRNLKLEISNLAALLSPSRVK